MIVLYTLLIVLLVAVRFLVGRRVAALEKKFARIARKTDELMREPRVKPGNSNRPDPFLAAKQAYLLGQAVEKRERVEARYVAWQKWADRFGALVRGVRAWQGRKLPYAVGVLDVLLTLGLLDNLGYRDQLNAQVLVEFLQSLVNKA